ncbi:MAG: hypothetical protein Q4C75_05135 [Bergeyella zoohelcum]|nr:hypothetical protein [Bergeyella zoohelcum]
MEQNYFKGESPNKGTFFIITLVAMLGFSAMGIGIDIDQLLQSQDQHISIPSWYFYIISATDLVLIGSILLIYFYRKIGVLLYPIAGALHFFFHLYYLNSFLYSDVFALFTFVGIGLFSIIPKWQFFR